MKLRKNLMGLLAGLLLALGPITAHAIAIYDASAEVFAAITQVSVNGTTFTDPTEFLPLLDISFDPTQGVTADVGPTSPPNSTFAQATVSAPSLDQWSVEAEVAGSVSVPGFAESSAFAEIEATIVNISSSLLTLTLELVGIYDISYSLDTPLESLDLLSAVPSPFIGIGAATPIFGPDSDSSSIGVGITGAIELEPGADHVVTLRAEAEGRVSAIPEPATLALFGLGLVGLGYQRRKRTA